LKLLISKGGSIYYLSRVGKEATKRGGRVPKGHDFNLLHKKPREMTYSGGARQGLMIDYVEVKKGGASKKKDILKLLRG